MKRYILTILLAILGGALIVWGVTHVAAQDASRTIYRLTPEKSQEFAKGEVAKRELERQWREIESQWRVVDGQQKIIMALSQIPESELDRKPVIEGDHFTFYPRPTPTLETKKP